MWRAGEPDSNENKTTWDLKLLRFINGIYVIILLLLCVHFWKLPFRNVLKHSVNGIFPPLPYNLTVLVSPVFLCSCEKLFACVQKRTWWGQWLSRTIQNFCPGWTLDRGRNESFPLFKLWAASWQAGTLRHLMSGALGEPCACWSPCLAGRITRSLF